LQHCPRISAGWTGRRIPPDENGPCVSGTARHRPDSAGDIHGVLHGPLHRAGAVPGFTAHFGATITPISGWDSVYIIIVAFFCGMFYNVMQKSGVCPMANFRKMKGEINYGMDNRNTIFKAQQNQ
jgi:hypothetical protein